MPVVRTVSDAQRGEIRLEAVHQPIYDSASVQTSVNSQFFQSPAGKTSYDTNLPTAGQLSWPKRFNVRALRQVAAPGLTPFADFASFLARATYKVVVGEKNYLTVPAFLITAGLSVDAANTVPATATTAGTTYANHGWGEHKNVYSLIHPIYIPPVQNFGVTLEIATGLSLTAAFKLHLFLEGELLREIQ